MAKAGPLRPVRVDGDVAYVVLTKGKEAIIDAADASIVGAFNWYTLSGLYAARKEWVSGRSVPVLLHRFLMNAPSGMEVDHVDGDGLNNRRCNLRLATRSENARNIGMLKNNTSGFKGVSWLKANRKWRAEIHANGRREHLGVFDTPEAAYAAYCDASARLHGAFARVE